MAQLNNVYDSYDATNVNKESLADIIYALNPADTPLLSNAAQGKARATLHEWTSDEYVSNVGYTNAQVEGDEYTNTAIVAPARNTNFTQIMNKVVSVTGTELATDTVGARDQMAYNIAKYSQLLKNDMEVVLCNNQAASAGVNNSVSATRTLRSFEAWVPTGNRSAASGTAAGTTTLAATDGTTGQLRAFTETLFMTVLENMYNAGSTPDFAILPSRQKTVFGGFSGQASRQWDSTDKRVVNMVNVYESDYGTIEARVSRFVRPLNISPSPGRSVLIAQKDMLEVAYLRPFEIVDLAKTGDADRKVLQAEFTFVPRNPNALGVVADLS